MNIFHRVFGFGLCKVTVVAAQRNAEEPSTKKVNMGILSLDLPVSSISGSIKGSLPQSLQSVSEEGKVLKSGVKKVEWSPLVLYSLVDHFNRFEKNETKIGILLG